MNKLPIITSSSIFLRTDFNVPIHNGVIIDYKRIDAAIPTILHLMQNNNKLVIASHLGRPKNHDQAYSLKPIYEYLQEKLLFFIRFSSEIQDLKKIKENEILFLENLRFHPEEETNGLIFTKSLMQNIDYYINEAFSCSHRAHASIMLAENFTIDKKFPGFLFQKEIQAIDNFINNAEEPSMAIIGGSKISTKIKLIKTLQDKVDFIFIGGAMANSLLHYQKYSVGKSLKETGFDLEMRKILTHPNCKVILPEDVMVAKDLLTPNQSIMKSISEVTEDEMIVDAGTITIERLKKMIDQCKNVIWNGPLGLFEVQPFDRATVTIAKYIAQKTADGLITSIIGGGDSLAAIADLNIENNFTHASTAGGAFLEYVEMGKDLVGLKALMI